MVGSLLIDEGVFDESFVPEKLTCREGQIREIARCLGPAKAGKSIRNLFVYGPPGVGKTVVCKWILKENFSSSAYVNCWSKRTGHKVMEQMLLQLGNVVHGRESFSELVQKFEKLKKRAIVCLDEIDHLKDKDLLYDLTRNSCGVILISNNPSAISDIDDRIKSGLLLKEVEFKPYSRDEVLSILKERISSGFGNRAISTSLLSLVAGMCGGDARIGLQSLKVAAKEAESKEQSTITLEEIKSAIKSTRKYRLSYLLGKLTDDQKTVYEILKKNRNMDSGKLYSEYCKVVKQPVVDRAYRKHMEKMEQMGLIRSAGVGRWKKYEVLS